MNACPSEWQGNTPSFYTSTTSKDQAAKNKVCTNKAQIKITEVGAHDENQ